MADSLKGLPHTKSRDYLLEALTVFGESQVELLTKITQQNGVIIENQETMLRLMRRQIEQLDEVLE